MVKNRKSFRSNRIVATLPYLTAPSDEEIDQMEIEFSLQQVLSKVTYEESFFQWMMEIDFAIIDEKMDDEICNLTEISFYLLTHEEELMYGDCDPWSGTGNDPDWYDWDLDTDLHRDNNCQLFGYQDFNYWNPEEPDPLQDPEDSFCPEQAILREIALRGLKHSARQALIREYCVH